MSAVRERAVAVSREEAPLPRTVLRVALSLLCVLGLGVGVYQLQPALNRPVSVIDVRGRLTRLDPRQITTAAAIASHTHLFDVNLGAVRRRVGALPWVASASVSRRWPSALEISVTERQPVARWGSRALLDRRAQVFTPRAAKLNAAQRQALPELSGGSGHEDDVLAAWKRLAPALVGTPLALASMSQNARGGFNAQTVSGITLHFGPGNPARRLQTIRDAVLPTLDGHFAKVAAIDLRYSNGFAVAPRSASTQSKRKT